MYNMKKPCYFFLVSTPSYADAKIYTIGITKNLKKNLEKFQFELSREFKYYKILKINNCKVNKLFDKLFKRMLKKQHYVCDMYYLSKFDINVKLPHFLIKLKNKYLYVNGFFFIGDESSLGSRSSAHAQEYK